MYENDDGDYLVQGAVVPATLVHPAVPEGEALVELPRRVITELVRIINS